MKRKKHSKIFVYNLREFDEKPAYDDYSRAMGIPYDSTPCYLTLETADLAADYDAVNIIYSKIDAPLLERWHALGVTKVISRTIGLDHVDLAAADRLGITVAHVAYPPDAVADYTLMLMLMGVRKLPHILRRDVAGERGFAGKRGKNLSEVTVGVIGTGAIGRAVIRRLQGFGPRILVAERSSNQDLANIATRLPQSAVLAQSDVITLHLASTPKTERLIDASAIAGMKDGVGIVNTARGSLIDTQALLEGLIRGKIGFAALDVVAGEEAFSYQDLQDQPVGDAAIAALRGLSNVIFSPHYAFYTSATIDAMARQSFEAIHTK